MKQLITDIISFIASLSFVDMVFFVAILLLFILIFVMIYIIKINVKEDEEVIVNKNPEEIIKETINKPESNILFSDEEEAIIDLDSLTRKLELTKDIDKYEDLQEEHAIISYEELLKNQRNDADISYKNEQLLNDTVSVKQIDLNCVKQNNDLVSINILEEENFLDALKQLQKSLY